MLRALLPGRPTLDCLFSNVLLDNATLLKVLPDGCVPCALDFAGMGPRQGDTPYSVPPGACIGCVIIQVASMPT